MNSTTVPVRTSSVFSTPAAANRRFGSAPTRLSFSEDNGSETFKDMGQKADKVIFYVVLMGLVAALLQGVAFDSLHEALGAGIVIALLSGGASTLLNGTRTGLLIQSFSLAAMSLLHVQLSRGIPEFHLSAFVLLPLLLTYRHWLPVVFSGGVIILGTIAMDHFQRQGLPVYAFKELGNVRAVVVSSLYLVCAVGILAFIAQVLRKHAVTAEETARLLSQLDQDGKVVLQHRAHAAPGQSLSRFGKVFNEYADNMSHIVAAFRMLKSDMQELSGIATGLRQHSEQQKESTENSARNVRELLDDVGKLVDASEGNIEKVRSTNEKCFDLLNRMATANQQLLVLGNRAGECVQLVQALLDQGEKQAALHSTVNDSGQLLTVKAALQALRALEEKCNGFMNEMSQQQKAVAELEDDTLVIQNAYSRWVQETHSNQRKAWELLGCVEGIKSRSEQSISTLNNSAASIERAFNLVREMERRLERFEL